MGEGGRSADQINTGTVHIERNIKGRSDCRLIHFRRYIADPLHSMCSSSAREHGGRCGERKR